MPAALPVIDMSQPLCCAPLGSPDFDLASDPDQIAARLRALADANRVRIVQELSCCEGHGLGTGDVARLLNVSDATASHHLKQLTGAGLLTRSQEGGAVTYRLNLVATRAISSALNVTCCADCECR